MKKQDIAILRRLQCSSNSSRSARKRKKSKSVKTQLKANVPAPNRLDQMVKSSMFRFLNEKLYTCTSQEALDLFSTDKQAFDTYHSGFQRQLAMWPDDPMQWILDYLHKVAKAFDGKRIRIADMGCGDARLARSLTGPFKVYSFDLIAVNDDVVACDMAKTPLRSSHVQFVVFCLSLMGTNCRDFLYEANRVLKTNLCMETIIAHVREGNLPEVRLWLDNTENDVNQGDEHRFSLLHWAAREGQLGIVDLLIIHGARVNATNMGDDTALHLAASHGHIDVVHYLLNCHRLNVDAPNEHGNTPLHYACFWNHLEISEYLIKHGANLMQENKYGETPLEIARPRAAALLAPLAEALGHDLSHRKPFRDTSWIGTKTRARDATLYRLDGESWDPHEVVVTGALADGHGAQVLKGSFRRCPVAVKVLKLRNCTIRQARDFKEEFPRLRIFNHPNILPVLAIFTATQRLCLVSDFMQFGSLYDVLHGSHELPPGEGSTNISFRQALRFAVDIARGMEFLHKPELRIPNFRLNSKHIMVDEDVAKLGIVDPYSKENNAESHAVNDEMLIARLDMADYKFSFHERSREYNPAWMSPEALTKKASDINLEASDMWSFGVVLWELVTRMIPFAGINPMVVGMQIALEHLRLTLPPNLNPRIARLIELCLKEDPGKRPRFDAQLIQLLDKMRELAGHSDAVQQPTNFSPPSHF